MGKSAARVADALSAGGLRAEIVHMPASTRTAEEAAQACGCTIDQIVKSLIFEGAGSGNLYLLLVSGANQVDLDAFANIAGESLKRADPKDVRKRTGFAIGGVAPVGHLEQPKTFIDKHLLSFETIWAAAGAPNAVFEVSPQDLVKLTQADEFTC